ncbi:MAG: hypothetical protein QGM50_00220 [Anaerolineae bacterium]|nr:hypothetical protein [Anaerolineae bacterium]MDK1117190.1 hypothetical protein [Anaerolineae bacterium]
MRTPAGKECKYFYGDYHRGRNFEECRLLNAAGQRWSADLCKSCPVPNIQMANACEFLQIRAIVTRPFSAAFQRRVQVTSSCDKTKRRVDKPHIGCGECHTLPFIFEVKE